MKKLFYILFAASALLFVSCAKEVGEIITVPEAKLTGETITFSATIDMPAATRAALSGLNINWQSGDYIAFATDNDATIRVYPVTVDGVDPTKCTITVDKVDGASGYYAIFKGSLGDGGAGVNSVDADDYSMVTFNTATKTFSGLTVGNQQVAENSLSSHLWYTNGYPLAMAGKADGSSLSMKPCLALVRLQIDAESVPADAYYKSIPYVSSYSVNHDHNYSAVRGFNLYQIGGSTIYSSGDYDVQIAADGSLTTTATSDKEYRQISQIEKLFSGTDYLMCLIPGGSISSFKIDFLGYSDNTPTLNWNAAYTMRLPASNTVAPGDYYDLGVLNPLGRKKAKNEAEDETADALAAVYVPAITIDGDMSDWASLAVDKVVGISAPSQDYQVFKVTYDELNMYFYSKRNLARQGEWPFYMWYEIDNNDDGTYEKRFYFYPYSKPESTLVINSNPASSNISGLTLSCAEHAGVDYVEFETSVPRSELNISNGNTLKFQSTINKVNTGATLTIAEALTIVD